MTKRRTIQIRVTAEEEKWIEDLAGDYGLDRSKLIMFSLEHIRENRPPFVIYPAGKEAALASVVA